MMVLKKKALIFSILVIMLMLLSTSSANYNGTGFSHDIPGNYHVLFSLQDVLVKYNESHYTSEKRAVCTHVVDGYVGNLNSHKFHRASCEGVDKMSEKNKVFFQARQDAIDNG